MAEPGNAFSQTYPFSCRLSIAKGKQSYRINTFGVLGGLIDLGVGAEFRRRQFSCTVFLPADERDERGVWRERVRARLVAECLARWNE